MTDGNISELLQKQVQQAVEERRPLNIIGGGSKAMLGRRTEGEALEVSSHRGIVDYDPRELVLTARAGTSLTEIESALAEHNQMLPFEPPHFGGNATLGGTIACGFSGPRRPYAGAARDFVLGCKLLNGKGEILHFGGQVMKNVAGYDVSRLMAGAWGTLGVLLEISLKVLPRPAASTTLFHECSTEQAIELMSGLLSKALPVDAACYYKGQCYIRLSGSEQSVKEAQHKLPGETLNPRSHFWQRLREHQLSQFNNRKPLWRIVVKPGCPPLPIDADRLYDWGGAQRWLFCSSETKVIRTVVQQYGGHATLFRSGDRQNEIFHPLSTPLRHLHQRLKASFDPQGIFNPGRMYTGL
jgi:glycolate oxidase FAD binding subunit